MENDPFLAMLERTLADAGFARALLADPAAALAAAGLSLAPADLAQAQAIVAHSDGDPAALCQALVEAALLRQQAPGQARAPH